MAHQHSLLARVTSAPEPLIVRSAKRSADPQGRGRRSDRKLPVAPVLDESLHLAQLLSSRMCHDLIGPIGIAAATDDLRDTDGRIDDEALALVADSAHAAASRLSLFRFAFGLGHPDANEVSGTFLASLLEEALANGRLRIEWTPIESYLPAADPSLPLPAARLVLCLALMATEALPRGGIVSLAVSRSDETLEMIVRAKGSGARMPSAALEAFHAKTCAAITPRTVVGYYAGQLAARMGAVLKLAGEPGGHVEFALAISTGERTSHRSVYDQRSVPDPALSDT